MAPQTSLFQVYLRLRPPTQTQMQSPSSPWLIVEPPSTPAAEQFEEPTRPSSSTHITLQPPNDSRKRAIERFGFTKVFQGEASQLDVFDEIGTVDSVKNLLASGRDGLIATLGVTGSGKSHTILGSKEQRGLTQMTLDVLFRSIATNIRRPDHPDLPTDLTLVSSLQSADPSEAQIVSATSFLDAVYGEEHKGRFSRAQTPMVVGGSRAQTPMTVWHPQLEVPGSLPEPAPQRLAPTQSFYPKLPGEGRESAPSIYSDCTSVMTPTIRMIPAASEQSSSKKAWTSPSKLSFWTRLSSPQKKCTKRCAKESYATQQQRRHNPLPRPSTFPQNPDVSSQTVEVNPSTDYVVLVSMYEVYNDRIFDLLSSQTSSTLPQMTTRQGVLLQKSLMRRPLLFKNTEMSPDRKVVAGLRKVVCGSYEEAIMVLEAGLTERRVAGTGSNSVSSRSHGFFCIEVKQGPSARSYGPYGGDIWTGGTLSIVDLAGSERARNAKTTGSTLAEAGKINESLMYLGQCLQVQSDCQQDGSKPIVPFRQCKLTELLFSNSFPSSNQQSSYKTPQRATMIVTADPQGDFNATSQILRYSALAREVTVPRIPSVTSTILAGLPIKPNGRSTPSDFVRAEELDRAVQEATRLTEECESLSMKLAEEEIKGNETQLRLHAAEERIEMIEQSVREEVWGEMEDRVEEERRRWREAWELEKLQGEKYLDGKIEILERNGGVNIVEEFVIHEDEFGERMEEVRRENDLLRGKVAALEQEIQGKSPTKKRSKGVGMGRSVLGESLNVSTAVVPKGEAEPVLQASPNPFLVSGVGLARELAAQDRTLLDVTRKIETVTIAGHSPRKASLRSSSLSSTIGLGERSSSSGSHGGFKMGLMEEKENEV